MNIKPRELVEELETVIIFVNLAPSYLIKLPIRFDVSKYICIHRVGDKLQPYLAEQFDKVIEFDYTQPHEKLVELVQPYIKNPEKTRLIPVTDCSTQKVAKLRDHFKIKGRTLKE